MTVDDTTNILSDEDMTTTMPVGTAVVEQGGPKDADGTDSQDADGTDGDATDGTDGDSSDGEDSDGTDGQDTDGTDASE